MKQFFLVCCLLLSISGFSQSLKKKHFATYEGTIPAYTIDLGESVIPVDKTPIRIQISEKMLIETIGTTEKKGTWSIVSEDKKSYTIRFQPENQLAEERLTVLKKGKKIIRKGIYPQPAVVMMKRK